MPRPREFDEDEVIESAMNLFWSRGYEATSVSDLMEATGLAKGSIYKGFGDKRAFFSRTLQTYLDRSVERVDGLLRSGSSAEQGLRAWLGMIVDVSTCKGERRGCYAVNCAIELAPHDPEIRARVQEHYQSLERRLSATIERGIESGEFDSGLNPVAAARSLTTLANGLQVWGKMGTSRHEALETVELAIRALR